MHKNPERIRVTISLSKDVADHIDGLVDGIKIRNRSHAVETLVTEQLQVGNLRQAVILAGGDDIKDRIPAITGMIQQLKEYGVTDITVAVGYLGDIVRNALQDGNSLGVRITYIQSENGTAGALRQAKSRIQGTFLVVNVTHTAKIDVNALVDFHQHHQPVATIATPSLTQLHGVYVCDQQIFHYIPEGFCMLEDDVFHELTKAGKLLPYPILSED